MGWAPSRPPPFSRRPWGPARKAGRPNVGQHRSRLLPGAHAGTRVLSPPGSLQPWPRRPPLTPTHWPHSSRALSIQHRGGGSLCSMGMSHWSPPNTQAPWGCPWPSPRAPTPRPLLRLPACRAPLSQAGSRPRGPPPDWGLLGAGARDQVRGHRACPPGSSCHCTGEESQETGYGDVRPGWAPDPRLWYRGCGCGLSSFLPLVPQGRTDTHPTG